MTIRTRFAPSPTGYLHIGGVRTALFNWLLARQAGGQFILRIDDTDAERNRPEALQPILDGFRWLGIDWDEGPEVGGPYGPYYQSQRKELYEGAALVLLAEGLAYPDYLTKDQLDAERKAAEAAKKPYAHRGPHRDTSAAECIDLYQATPTTLRLKVPAGRTLAIEDAIRGRVEWQSDLVGDPVILRADGRALYNFATVIDDAALRITHVVRAAEHLTNTAVQLVAYEGLGLVPPIFAHVPVVNEPAPKPGTKYPPDVKPPNPKKKLSKREMAKFVTPEVRAKLNAVGWADEQISQRDDLNPATVAFYRELGYLPAGLVNYLGRLGWSLDDKAELIPIEQMIAHFSLGRVNQSPASFDPDKLYWVAGEYMRNLPLEQKVAGVLPFLQRAGLVADDADPAVRAKVAAIVEGCGDRLKLFSDILFYGGAFFRPDPEIDPKAFEKCVARPGTPELLRELRGVLTEASFEREQVEGTVKAFAEARGAKLGTVMQALRVSLVGTDVGLPVDHCLAILGREETVRRIDRVLARVMAGP